MGKINVVQTDFLAGEISPRMEMQDNLEGRRHGVELMKNWIPHLQGSAETSPGFEYVMDIAEDYARIFTFPYSRGTAIVVIGLTHLYIIDLTATTPVLILAWTTTIPALGGTQAVMMPRSTAHNSSMVIVAPGQAVQELIYFETTDSWAVNDMAFLSAPAEWADTPPQSVGFFGGRMWFGAGGDSGISTFWGSKSGKLRNFTLGSLPDDAIELSLGKYGSIQWIVGGQGLLMGTDNAEFIISGSDGLIIPGDIRTKVQSTFGSLFAQALEVGNETLYISPDGRKIRSISYEWNKDAWRSRDLTYASEHITKDNILNSIVHSANPNSLIIGVTNSGALVIATYETASQTVGFSRRVTQGFIMSAATRSEAGYDEVWVIVNRGTGELSLERTTYAKNVKLDSFKRFTGTGISGGTAPHLANKDCQILVDGAVHPNVTPNGSGVFETEYSGDEILIGLKIDSVIRTLPVEGSIANIGSTRPMKKRLTDVWVKVLDSWAPMINGRRASTRRAATPMGEVEPSRTETVRVSNEGWGDEVQVTIEQDLPLRTEIAGWFGQIIQEKI